MSNLRFLMTFAMIFCLYLSIPSLARGFSSIPVTSIYSPLRLGSADEELASGHVIRDNFVMAKPATKPWRIAFLFPHMKDPYWIGCDYGVISEARRLGIQVDIFPAEGYDDLIGQLRMMDEAIAAKYDAIVISPISMTANNPSIAKAHAVGIPVFELANDSSSRDLTLKVTTSLKDMGLNAMKWVIKDAQMRGLKAINIVLLPGPADAGWVKGEVAGTREAIGKSAIKVNILDIKYGDSDRIIQSRLAAELISRYGEKIDYILGCTGCAPAALLPINDAKMNGRIRIVAFDLTREIARLVKDGEISAAADTKGVSQARVVTDAAVNFLEGRTWHMPKVMLIKLGLIDQSHYSSYKLDTSIAPRGYEPELSYVPKGSHKSLDDQD